LVAIALESILKLPMKPFSWRRISRVAFPILLLPLVKLRFLALSISLLGLAWLHTSARIRTLLVRGGIILTGLTAITLLFNQAVFGLALKQHTWQSLTAYFVPPTDYLIGPLGLFFDHAFGLFLTSPIWLLLILGAWETYKCRRRLLIDTTILCMPILLLLGPRGYWYGGWSPPFRYGIVLLPLLSLLAVPVLARRREAGVRFLIGLLLAATLTLTVIWLVLPGWTYNFADGRSHLVDYLTRSYGTDVARLLPSFVRPRSANLFWIISLLMLIPSVAFGFRRKRWGAALTCGLSLFPLLLAILPALASRLPISTIEFEDPYVRKIGGSEWPTQWAPNRPAFRGSWRLRPGNEVEVRLMPRGDQLSLVLEARTQGPRRASESLEILAGDNPLARVGLPPSNAWSRIEFEPIDWPSEARTLTVRMVGRGPTRLLLDRAHLSWQ
jgi:hypothetical protein